MSVASEPYRTLNWPSRRSASLPRRTGLRQRHHNRDLSPYSNDVFPSVTTLPSSLRSYTSSTRDVSHEPSAVDPRLRDAQKLGGNYHITLNLNTLLNHPVNVAYNEAVTSADYMMPRSPSSLSSVSGLHRRPRGLTQLRGTATNTGGGGGRRSVARMSVGDDQEVNGHHQLQLVNGRRSTLIDGDGYVIQSVRATSRVADSRPQSVEQHKDEGFVIRAVTPCCSAMISAQREERMKEDDDDMVSFDLQLIGLHSSSSSSKNQQTSYVVKEAKEAPPTPPPHGVGVGVGVGVGMTNERLLLHRTTTERRRPQMLNDDVEPMYTMTIDETMTMDYYQPPPSPAAAAAAAAAASDSRRSVAKQAKSKMPLPPPSRSKVHPLSASSSVHPLSVSSPTHPASAASFSAAEGALKSATRATHRKRPIPAKKDTEEPREAVVQKVGRRPPDDLQGSKVIDRWSASAAEQWKRMRNVKDESNERFVVSNEALKARYLGLPRPDLLGQGLMSTSSHRSLAIFDEADGVIAPTVQSAREEATGRRMAGGSDEEFHTEIKVSRGSTRIETRGSDVPWHTGTMASLANGLRDQQSSGQSTMSSSYVRRLMKDAPPQCSVHQRFDIEEQEQVIGPLEDKAASANSFSSSSSSDQTSTHNLLNADLVSEQVDVRLEDGFANLVVKVTCERLVPIHGSAHMYKKLSITVSRFIDVDLMVTGERRRIYDQVMENSLPSGKLSNRDTFELYIAFMQLADLHPSPELDQQQLWIDKKVDENKLTKYASLENQFGDSDGITTLGHIHRGQRKGSTNPLAELWIQQ